MHAWIYQISDAPIKEAINEDTLYQGDGTDYDYCAAIMEEGRKSVIEALKDYILPSGMFQQIDDTTFEYQGGHRRVESSMGRAYSRPRIAVEHREHFEIRRSFLQTRKSIKEPSFMGVARL